MNNAPLAAVFSFFIAISAMAQTTSDPKVQAALYDLGRAEQQLKSAQPGRVSALKRIAGMLENAELQLSASASPGEPGWSDAKNRLGQLKQRLQQLQNPQATQASASASSSGTNSPLSASDRSTLGDISRRTDSLAKDLARYSPKDLTTYEKLLMGKITDLKQRYQQLQNQAHPEAIGVAQKVIALETQIQSGANQNKQQASAAGELAPRLAAIGKRVQATRQGWATTPLPAEPYTTENTRDFAAKMMRLTEQLQQDAQFIEGIDQSLRNSISDGLANQIAGQQKRTERHKDELANNLERRLTQTDRLAGNASRLWGSDITKAIEKLETGVELIDVAEGYQTLLGRQHTASSDRRTRYTSAIKSLEAAAKAEAENPQPTTASTKPAKPNFDPQRIELFGTRLIELTADGEIWIDGEKEGDLTADGEIWVAGDKEGDITDDGEVWQAGDKVGDVTATGDVWRLGNQVGNVATDGTIWINSSRQGQFKGGKPAHAAALVFYGFFSL